MKSKEFKLYLLAHCKQLVNCLSLHILRFFFKLAYSSINDKLCLKSVNLDIKIDSFICLITIADLLGQVRLAAQKVSFYCSISFL